MNINSNWWIEWTKCGCKKFTVDEENRVFKGSLGGHLADLIEPEKKCQFRLSNNIDPDGDCYVVILKEAGTTNQIDGFCS